MSFLFLQPARAITPLDASNILFIKQEEKLARDVYLALYERWGQNTFRNIGQQSEQQHMNAVDGLIALYSLTDTTPAARGVFTIPELQALHDELLAKGNRSLIDALLVGILIEEVDIRDLQAALDATREAQIKTVFTSLQNGSRNHLAAFSKVLAPLYTRLTAPAAGLSATPEGAFEISWTDPANNETAFVIERRRAGFPDWERLGEVAANTIRFVDTNPPIEVAFYRVLATNSYESGPASEPVFGLRAFDSYLSWRDAVFAAGERESIGKMADDPDGDGIANAAEYAFGLTPRQALAEKVNARLEVGRLKTSTFRRAAMNDVSLRVRTSSDLLGWQTVLDYEEQVLGSGPGVVQVEISVVGGLDRTGFLQLGVGVP